MHSVANGFPTPFPELNRVLDELVRSQQVVLGASFVGTYLQGSFATGGFDRHSDVDLAFVTAGELSAEQAQALQAMHARIFDQGPGWAKHLEGSYFPRAILRSLDQRGVLLWYLDNGSRELVRSEHCNTAVVRWVVRERGGALAGPAPAELVDPVPVETLLEEIRQTMRDWGGEILANPAKINNRFYQGFAVLSYCRMLHSLHTGEVRSKREGAEWAKANLDPSWQGLIDRTWDTRPQPEVSSRQPADPSDLLRTLEFIQYIINLSVIQ